MEERKKYYETHLQKKRALAGERNEEWQSIYARQRDLTAQEIRERLRPYDNTVCVRCFHWTNTQFGRRVQKLRFTDLCLAREYEQQLRNPSADVCLRMEALEDSSPLQNPGGVCKTYTKSFWHGGTGGQEPYEEKVEYKSRDKEPWDSIPRAISIATSTFGIDPAYPSPPVFAQDVRQAQRMLAMFRMRPVHGGDPRQCPVIGALDTEGITGTEDMLDDSREIRLIHADSWERQVQDFPAAEYQVAGLATNKEKAIRNKNSTPLLNYPIKPPDQFAYYLWKDEFKAKLRYVPNVQTSSQVPFVLVLTGPHMPVMVIPFHLLFEPDSLFPEQMKRQKYYQTTGDPKVVEVDADLTPSVPSQWALDELSGAADRSLGYLGKVWLVVNIRAELAWLTKAFSGVTLTRTSYSGSPGTDTWAGAKPKLGFRGRQGGPKSNCYIPALEWRSV